MREFVYVEFSCFWIFPKTSLGVCQPKKKFEKIGGEGLLALIGDSTNANVPGKSQSENDVMSVDSKITEPKITISKTINPAVEEYNNDSIILETNQQAPNSSIYDLIAAELLLDHHIDEAAVKKQIDWLLKNPEYLTRVIEKSGPYIHYVYARIKESGLPIEITLLPIIESAYDPLAYSQSHASGLWQFTPSTAAYLGLERP